MASHPTGHLKQIVGANLADAARDAGLTQRQVADAVGATPAQVSKWFGGSHEPGFFYRAKLADLLTGGDVAALYREREAA